MDVEDRLISIEKNVKELIAIINKVVIDLENCSKHRIKLYEQNALIVKKLNGYSGK